MIEVKPLFEINRDAFRVLNKEIGIANTIRFISQFTSGYGNYVEERQQLFAGISLEEITTAIKAMRKPGSDSPR